MVDAQEDPEKARKNVEDAMKETDKPQSKVWEKEDLINQKEEANSDAMTE